jgi:hypothetical protein
MRHEPAKSIDRSKQARLFGRTNSMSPSASPIDRTREIGPIVLWREDHTRCECTYSSSTWTLRLWVGQTMARERVEAGVGLLLRAAQLWRETEVKFRFAAWHSPVGFKNDRHETLPTPSLPDRPTE